MSCAATQAIARVRHEPDLVAVRRLEALLNWQAEKPRHGSSRGSAWVDGRWVDVFPNRTYRS